MSTRDNLNLFKRVWYLLKILASKIAKKLKIKLDLVQMIMPQLQKVAQICKDGLPPLEMHHFLKLILSDLSSKQLRKNRKLRQFLLDFLLILCNVIPHNLHDEIFQIMQQVLALC